MDEIQGYLLTPLIFQVYWLTLKIWGGGWGVGGFNLSHLLAGDCATDPTPPSPLPPKLHTTTTKSVSVWVWYSYANPGAYTPLKA